MCECEGSRSRVVDGVGIGLLGSIGVVEDSYPGDAEGGLIIETATRCSNADRGDGVG